jgi:UDP-N-acetylglucosamine 3-dehydrogenase
LKDTVNIAVIGAGYWGKKVVSEYLRLASMNPKVRLQMICDVKDENLKYCGETFRVPEKVLIRDYEEAIGSDVIDGVHICTPNETHYQICREMLRSDKHVVLEKPMALQSKQAWELVGLAESKHLILQVGHIFRFNNALKMMRELISENYLGKLYYLKLQWTTLMPSPVNRDIIFDLGPHPVDILHFMLKKWPTKVVCKGQAYRRESLEELAYMTLEYEDKLMAHIELSWLQPGKARHVSIIGSERSANIDCLSQNVQICENSGGGMFSLNMPCNNTLLDEVNHFVESVQTGKNSNNLGSVGAKNVTVLENLKKSLEEERTMKISLEE